MLAMFGIGQWEMILLIVLSLIVLFISATICLVVFAVTRR